MQDIECLPWKPSIGSYMTLEVPLVQGSAQQSNVGLGKFNLVFNAGNHLKLFIIYETSSLVDDCRNLDRPCYGNGRPMIWTPTSHPSLFSNRKTFQYNKLMEKYGKISFTYTFPGLCSAFPTTVSTCKIRLRATCIWKEAPSIGSEGTPLKA